MKEMEQTRRKQGNSTKELTRNSNAILLAFLPTGKQTMKSEVGKKWNGYQWPITVSNYWQQEHS
jgi:hypothetical protein